MPHPPSRPATRNKPTHDARYAYQGLKQTASKGLVVDRWGICPTHKQKSSDFQGPDEHGWLFRCAERPLHMSHLFHVRPAKSYPKTVEEIPAWTEMERARLAREGEQGA